MAQFDYQYATGWDNEAGFVNVETTLPSIHARMHVDGIPTLGSIDEYAADGTRRIQGNQTFAWIFDRLSPAEFNTLITAMFGDRNTSSAKLTIRTRSRTFSGGVYAYANYNVIASTPLQNFGGFSQVVIGREHRNVVIKFVIVSTT